MEINDNKHKKTAILGRFVLLSVTVIWGSSFVILKDTLETLGGGHFTFFILAARFLLGAIFLALFGIKRMKHMTRQTVKNGVFTGIILFAAYAVQTIGLKYTTASKNAFLTAAYCVMVPFLVWIFYRSKPKVSNVAAATICLSGIACIAFGGKSGHGSNEFLGDCLSFACGVFFALQIVFNEKFSKQDDPVCLITVVMATAGVLHAAVSCAAEFSRYASSFSVSGEAALKIGYLALFATCYCQFGQCFGQKYVPANSSSLILSLEAVFGTVFGILLGNDKMTVPIVIGFVFVFISELLSEFGFPPFLRKKKKEDKERDKEN